MAELVFLMDSIRPKTVITRKDKSVFDKEYIAEDAYVRAYLTDHYSLEGIVGRAEIFTRLEGQ